MALGLLFSSGVTRGQDSVANPNSSSNDGSTRDEVLKLSPFSVNAASEENGYGATDTVSSSRIAIKYVDTAQSISVITSQYINDYNIQDTNQLFESLPNVVSNGGTRYVGVQIRGSSVTSQYIDGVFDPSTDSVGMPLQFYDRVELVRGPASAAFGVGEPGGIINYVTKVPTGKTDTTVQLGYGAYKNYLFNLDTEGTINSSMPGKISYRFVAFGDLGNYQLDGEYHRGAGALLSLRDDINDTTKVETYVAYSRITIPEQANSVQSYENQTGYTVDLLIGGPTSVKLPNTNPNIVYPSATSNYYDGNYAGGTLLPKNYNFFAPGFSSGDTVTNVRISFALEKTFLDKALTIRDVTSVEKEDDTYQFQYYSSVAYLIPGTQTPSGNLQESNLNNFAFAPTGVNEIFSWNFIGNNLDIDYRKHFFGGDWRFDGGGQINQNSPFLNAEALPILNANGSQRWETVYNRDMTPYNIYGSASVPWTTIVDLTNKVYSYGFYLNGEVSYFKGLLNLEGGDRLDWGGYTQNIFEGPTDGLPNAGHVNSQPPTRTKGAPRGAIRIKPFSWLSFYALWAQHNDPGQLVQKYGSNSGAVSPAVAAKYNNFNTYFTYVPTGTLKEYGVKASYLDGKLQLGADYFQFTTAGGLFTTGITEPNPNGGVYSIFDRYTASNHVNGTEIELTGRPIPPLIFTASYGIARGEASPFADGNPQYISPPTTATAHFKYTFGILTGMDLYVLAGGTRWGPYWANQDPYIRYTSAQIAWDGGIGFRWDHGRQSIDFVFNNLSSKPLYLQQGYSAGGGGPGFSDFVKYTHKF